MESTECVRGLRRGAGVGPPFAGVRPLFAGIRRRCGEFVAPCDPFSSPSPCSSRRRAGRRWFCLPQSGLQPLAMSAKKTDTVGKNDKINTVKGIYFIISQIGFRSTYLHLFNPMRLPYLMDTTVPFPEGSIVTI